MKFKSDIEIQAGVEAGGSTGSNGQVLSSTGSGVAWIDQSAVSADSAESVHISVKNTSGAQILKGTPVYVTGETGNSGKIEIAPADASDSAKMPALGLLESTLANNGEGFCVQGGLLEGLATATIDGTSTTANDTVYVKSGGGLTMTKPTGTGLIQNIAKVARVHASNGSLVVSSILRTNDVPNLPTGRIWVGDGNTIVSDTVYIDEPNNRVGIGTTAPEAKLEIKKGSSGLTSVNSQADALFLQSSSSTGITIATPDANKSSIFFSSASRQIGARINWSYDDLLMTLGTATANASLALKSGNESEAVRILSNGNVGIGTTAPNSKLHIKSADFDDHIALERGADVLSISPSGGQLIFEGGVSPWTNINENLGRADKHWLEAFVYSVRSGGNLQFKSNGNNVRMHIASAGNVGIGTTDPQAKLHINRTTLGEYFRGGSGELRELRFSTYNTSSDHAGHKIDASSGNGEITLATGGIARVTVDNTGKVGIGTASPTAKLQVAGTTTYNSDSAQTLRVCDAADVSKGIHIGFDTTLNAGVIQAGDFGVSYKSLVLNPNAGNIGIGTTTPNNKLDVNGDVFINSNYTANVAAQDLTIGKTTTGDHGITIATGPTYTGSIYFGDSGNNDAGIIKYQHSNNSMQFVTNRSEAMRINSSGNVGIGTTNPGTDLEIGDGTGSPGD